jgi:hypothetical protein
MLGILQLLGTVVVNLFKSRKRLEVENLFLRHQLNIALRRLQHRSRLRSHDKALLAWMTRLWPGLLGLSRVVQPGTILRWHRAGFRAYWRWKSRGRPGRPRVSRELRELIRRMSKENPLWGALRAFMADASLQTRAAGDDRGSQSETQTGTRRSWSEPRRDRSRTAEAGICDRRVDRFQVHDAASL